MKVEYARNTTARKGFRNRLGTTGRRRGGRKI